MGTMLVLTPALRMVGEVVVRCAASVVGSAAMMSSTSHPKNHRLAMPILYMKVVWAAEYRIVSVSIPVPNLEGCLFFSKSATDLKVNCQLREQINDDI